MMKDLQKMGGIAALGHTTALVVGMILSFTLMYPLLEAAPDQALKFLAENQILVFIWTLVVNWGTAITLLVTMAALYVRMKADASKHIIKASVIGCIWAVLVVGTSDLMLKNFGVVANLHGNYPAQVAAWTVLARSLWVLLLSLAILRTGKLDKPLGYLGMFLGFTGTLTLIPSVTEIMFMIFGPGMMIWSAWLGIAMLRRSPSASVQQQDDPAM
jgi:hypothetical protein